MTSEARYEDFSPEDYSVLWGCDSAYEKYPQEKGDGELFYQFPLHSYELDFLEKIIPAIDRLIDSISQSPYSGFAADVEDLLSFKAECWIRLSQGGIE